jgi:hypothetical protein
LALDDETVPGDSSTGRRSATLRPQRASPIGLEAQVGQCFFGTSGGAHVMGACEVAGRGHWPVSGVEKAIAPLAVGVPSWLKA